MQVKLLDYGVPSEMQPKRAHANDVGADVYALKDRKGCYDCGCGCYDRRCRRSHRRREGRLQL